MKNSNLSGTVEVNTDDNMTGTVSSNYCSTETSFFNPYSKPVRIDVIEQNDCIEFIYKETHQISYTNYPAIEPEERVFKIIFSCKNGKWNKSDRLYGEIIPSSDQDYVF